MSIPIQVFVFIIIFICFSHIDNHKIINHTSVYKCITSFFKLICFYGGGLLFVVYLVDISLGWNGLLFISALFSYDMYLCWTLFLSRSIYITPLHTRIMHALHSILIMHGWYFVEVLYGAFFVSRDHVTHTYFHRVFPSVHNGTFDRLGENRFYIIENSYILGLSMCWTLLKCNCISSFSTNYHRSILSVFNICVPILFHDALCLPSNNIDFMLIALFILQNIYCLKNANSTKTGMIDKEHVNHLNNKNTNTDVSLTTYMNSSIILTTHIFPLIVALYDIKFWYTVRCISLQTAFVYCSIQLLRIHEKK